MDGWSLGRAYGECSIPEAGEGSSSSGQPVFIFVSKTTAICAGGTLKKNSEDPIAQKKNLLEFLISRDMEMDTKIR